MVKSEKLFLWAEHLARIGPAQGPEQMLSLGFGSLARRFPLFLIQLERASLRTVIGSADASKDLQKLSESPPQSRRLTVYCGLQVCSAQGTRRKDAESERG